MKVSLFYYSYLEQTFSWVSQCSLSGTTEFDVLKKMFYFAGLYQLKLNTKWAIQQIQNTATKSTAATPKEDIYDTLGLLIFLITG